VVEANILMAGLGFENAGLSLAHAMTRGLVRTPGVDHCLHGYHVAYGLLIQLTIEERGDAFIDDIAAFYTQVGLPRSLKDLGLPRLENDAIESMAKNVTAAPKGAYLVVPVGPERLKEAIYYVETRYSSPAIVEQQIG
jgi:glycerol dehydrogenase